MFGEVNRWPPRLFIARLLASDVQCSAKFAEQRSMFQDKSGGLQHGNEGTWGSRMNDVIRDDFQIWKSLMGCYMHELVLAHSHLTPRLYRPHSREMVLCENLGIPIVRLKEEKLPSRFEQTVKGGEILRILVVAQNRGADHIIETLRRKIIGKTGYLYKPYVRNATCRVRKLLIEHSRGDGVLASQDRGKMLCPQPATCPQFEYGF